jgi:hypothetical protein
MLAFPPIVPQVTTTSNTSGTYTYTTSNTSPNTLLVSNGTSANWASITADPNIQGNSLKVIGDADFEGDVKIKGKSLRDSLEKIEARLAILHPNEELEKKWEELRELRNAYIKLEEEIKEKEKIWSILKR